FDKIVRFVSTGGYALATYERYTKLKQMPDGRYRISHPRLAQQSIPGDASEALLREAAEELIAEAMGHDAALKV
ncbi:MAG: hypothetical protein WA453_08450, partial [Methyloceanibacter sp.]